MGARDILRPGDVLIVRTGGTAGELIRIGEELTGKAGPDNHVAVLHHWAGNVPWGLEGRPGGVGWRDLRCYLASEWTVNNCAQPGRTDLQRSRVADQAKALLGTAYDWGAIGGDTLAALHIHLWNLRWPHGQAPGEVVCSSYAAWLYAQAGWDHPSTGDERECEPADWTAFALKHHYSVQVPV